MKKIKLFEDFISEVSKTMISGNSGRTITALDNRKYELKKEVKDAKIGDYSNVVLPKGTIITNLPGGVFAKHDDLKQKYCIGYKSERWSEDFGVMIKSMPDTLTAIEKDSKVLESISESKGKFPDQVEGNDGIIFKKISQSGDRARYNQYYRGYDIDFGGHVFGSVDELERFMKNYILSNNLYNKYKYMPEKPIGESVVNEGTYNNDKEIAIYDGEDGLTYIEKRGKGYYGHNDEFDFEADDKAELEKKLKSWKYKLISGSID